MTIKELILYSSVVILTACATLQKPVNFKTQPLLLDTKVQIKDLRKDESHSVKIEIFLLTDQAIRMEVTALFGYPIASIVMTPESIKYALHTSKKFVDGPFTAKTLYPVFKQNIDPNILWNSIHSRSPQAGNLKCQEDSQGRPSSCANEDGVAVNWSYENQVKRRIEIKNQNFQMIWVFKNQKPLEAAHNETFVLKKPEEYQQIQIK